MLNRPIPQVLRDVLDRCGEVCKDAANRIEFDPGRDATPRALAEIRAAAKVIQGIVDEEHSGRPYMEALQVVMAARTTGEVVRECQTRKHVR